MKLALALSGSFAHELHGDFLTGRQDPFEDRPEPALAEAVDGGERIGGGAEERVGESLRRKWGLQIRWNGSLASDLAVENDGEEEKC